MEITHKGLQGGDLCLGAVPSKDHKSPNTNVWTQEDQLPNQCMGL